MGGVSNVCKKRFQDRITHIGITVGEDYTKVSSKCTFKCEKGHTWRQSPGDFNILRGCPICYSHSKKLDTVIYIWKSIGENFNGLGVYKIGVSSSKNLYKRINKVAKKALKTPEIIVSKQVKNVRKLEAFLLTLGVETNFSGFDGCSEFRAMSADDVARAVNIVALAP
jgi:hypothetical protein